MDQELKQEFEKIDRRFADNDRNFEILVKAVRDGFDHVEATMATKDELRQMSISTKDELRQMSATMATKDELRQLSISTKNEINQMRLEMEDGFSTQRAETKFIKEKLELVDQKVDRLFRTETEDVEALMIDMEKVKRQLAIVK